jgi:hypothetical protein
MQTNMDLAVQVIYFPTHVFTYSTPLFMQKMQITNRKFDRLPKSYVNEYRGDTLLTCLKKSTKELLPELDWQNKHFLSLFCYFPGLFWPLNKKNSSLIFWHTQIFPQIYLYSSNSLEVC